MTLPETNSKYTENKPVRLRNEPYLVINTFLAAVVIFVMVYSAVFSPYKNNYPVVCVHEKLTGIKCASCGLSHSFSLIIKGRIEEASTWNENGMRVFLFFAVQLFLRAGFSVVYIKRLEKRRNIIVVDSVLSGLLFVISFFPFLAWLIKMIGS